MTRPRHIHPLCLLALFQLVGGPVVLMCVILFSKLSVPRVAEHGLALGVTKAWQSYEWQAAMDDVLHGEAGLPTTQKDKVPAKLKEAKEKIWAVELEKPVMAPACEATDCVPLPRSDGMATTRSHAPPIPPPRLA